MLYQWSYNFRFISTTRSRHALKMSTTHKGNAFEERSLKILEQTMSMTLKRVGGKEDGGIDLLGWWWLPYDNHDVSKHPRPSSLFDRRRIRVIGQCKAEKKKMGPNYVRELEGVMYRLLATGNSSSPSSLLATDSDAGILAGSPNSQIPIVALLISESVFTKSTLLRAHSSPVPFFLLHLPPVEERMISSHSPDNGVLEPVESLGSLGAAMCNPALCGSRGLLKGQMEVRWERHFLGQESAGRPALWWQNEKLQSWIPDVDTVRDMPVEPIVANG